MSENTNKTTITTNFAEEKVNENLMKLYVLGSTITQDIALLQLHDPNYDENGNIDKNDDQVINILIDSGMGIDEETVKIQDGIAKLNKNISNETKKIKESDVRTSKKHLEVLHDLKIKKIDYIYITHFHYDHVKGLVDIINGYNNSETNESYASIDTQNAFIFLPQKPHKNYKTVDNYINLVYGLAKSKNMTVIIPGHTAGKVIDTDGNYDIQETTDTEYLRNKTIFKIGPNQELELDFKNYDTSIYYNSTGEIDDYNDTSLCCVMTFGSNRIGFFGDIDYTAQKQLTGKIGHLDLMNVEHHGLNSGYYRPFFDSIAPKTCFTQDGYKDAVRGTLYLAERCKTHAYLQENGIPNFATSINETMVFNIYKTGITTNANAVKYAININGYSSYMGSINNTTAATTADIGLATLLKNMEHGTLVSTMINKNDNGSKLWADLLEGLTEDTVKVSELIVYKGGSSYHNQSMNGSSDAGYIILIPHTSNPLSGPIMTHWYTTDEYKSIKFVLKPLTNKSHFKCVKEANYTGLSTEVYDCDFLTTRQLTEDEKKSFGLNGAGYIFVPDNACTVNYTVYFRNLNSESVTVKYYDGDSKKSVSIPSKSGITIPNYAVLSTDLTSNNKLTIPEINGVYVKVCGYITYSKTTPKTTLKHPTSDVYPTFNTYPEF